MSFEPIAAATRPPRLRRRRRALTVRQRDCLLLVARGKSDREIAAALGISNQTVHKHVEAAKKRFDVSTRMQLVIHALFARQLELSEVIAGA